MFNRKLREKIKELEEQIVFMATKHCLIGTHSFKRIDSYVNHTFESSNTGVTTKTHVYRCENCGKKYYDVAF